MWHTSVNKYPVYKAYLVNIIMLSEILTYFVKTDTLIDMETVEVLEKIGLNEKEASVYLALLELGTASVLSIASKAGLKRPTTYLILDDLVARGLVSQVPQHKKTLYTAEAPEKLFTDLQKKQELLKRFLPNLEALHNQKKEKPQVQLFQGKEGILEVYEKIYAHGEVWFFATLGDLDKVLPHVTKEVARRAKEHKLVVREILSGSEADVAYAKDAGQSTNYTYRFAPKGLSFFTDNAIFGNSVAFFSFNVQLFAVVITSKEIAGSLRSLYEMAWNSAPLIDQIKK